MAGAFEVLVANGVQVLIDARDGFTFANINRMYNQLLAGAKLLVMIPNITSIEKTGPEITVGGYGKMLELASGHAGVWIGKPSRMMFDIALSDLELNNREVLMVGDNIDIDVDGARAVDVNEQNPQALAFYKRQGFRIVGRSAQDGQGMPYPLLHMVWQRPEK